MAAKLTPGYAELHLKQLGPVQIVNQGRKSKLSLAAKMLDSMRERGRRVQSPVIGKMYYYQYDPKTKDTLPYWDQFPVMFPIQLYPDGWLGVNFHYLDQYNRAILMDRLSSAYVTGRNARQRLQLSYSVLSGAAKVRAFYPCLKRYLASYVRSPLLEVSREDWTLALMLPLAKFHGASEGKVHRDSRKRI